MNEQYKEPLKVIEKLDLPESSDTQEHKKVHCPSCASEVAAADIHLDKAVAKCGNCNALFSIENIILEVRSTKSPKDVVSKPKGIEVNEFGDEVEFSVEAASYNGIGFIIWTVFLLAMTFGGLLYFSGKMDSWIPMVVSSLLFILSSVDMAKYSRYKFLVIIAGGRLNVINPSMYLIKDSSIDTSDIDQIYIKHNVMTMNGTMGYSVNAVVNAPEGQVDRRIVQVKTITQAQFLEQEIERRLGIKDRRIPQETS